MFSVIPQDIVLTGILNTSLFPAGEFNSLRETGIARKFNNANEMEAETRHRKRSIVVSQEIY